MSEIPDDIRETADALWIRALNDGTPDAATMIAEAILAERRRCTKIVEGAGVASRDKYHSGEARWIAITTADHIVAALKRKTAPASPEGPAGA